MTYTTFLFLGKPGSGKGAQAKLLSEKTGFKVVPLGKRFREIALHNTLIGHKVKDIIEHGHLMPYWFASHLFLDAVLALENNEGAIFDGSSRKKPEAVLFHDVMTWLERPYKVFHVSISDETAVARILKRKEVEGRSDDTEEAVRIRLEEHHKEAEPVIEFLRSTGNMIDIDGERSIDEIHAEIMKYTQ